MGRECGGGSLRQHGCDVILIGFVRDIPGSGIDQFAGYVEFVKFFPQQDSEVRRVCGIFCDLAFGWGCAVVEIDGWITC